MKYDYIKNPQQIYDLSFSLVRQSADFSHLGSQAEAIAVRMVHACAEPKIVEKIRFSKNFIANAKAALLHGAPIIVDCEMLKKAVMTKMLPDNNQIICCLNEKRTNDLAKRLSITRSAAAVESWQPYLPKAIVAIGNAPTALFRLLEKISDDNNCRPLALIALPIGFVGAAEAKMALQDYRNPPPFLTVNGKKGGSAMAAAAINALNIIIKQENN